MYICSLSPAYLHYSSWSSTPFNRPYLFSIALSQASNGKLKWVCVYVNIAILLFVWPVCSLWLGSLIAVAHRRVCLVHVSTRHRQLVAVVRTRAHTILSWQTPLCNHFSPSSIVIFFPFFFLAYYSFLAQESLPQWLEQHCSSQHGSLQVYSYMEKCQQCSANICIPIDWLLRLPVSSNSRR